MSFLRSAVSFSTSALSLLSMVLVAAAPAPLALAEDIPPMADGPGGLGAVKKWSREHTTVGEAAFAASGAKRYGSPFFWGDEVVYQIQVDRFNDGDPSNNSADIEEHQRNNQGNSQSGLADYKHGGDLAGVTERLDYLRTLGVTSLWITPILKGNGSYHGYCTSDYTKVDPTFGDLAALQRLTREAHARGIRVILDVVVNHMCDVSTRYDAVATPFMDWAYGLCVNDLDARMWSGGGSVRGQRKLLFSDRFFGPLRSQEFFSRCGHKSGDFSTGGNGAVYGDFSDAMFDLDTQNWDFQEIFTELHKYWIAAADIDGFRVDAAKHVTPDFLAKFSTDTREYARKLGKNNFLMVGEVASDTKEQAMRLGRMRTNPLNPDDRSTETPESVRARLKDLKNTYSRHPMFPLPGLNAVYDFAHSGQMVEMWRHNASPRTIKNWFYAGGEMDNAQCSAPYCEVEAAGDTRLSWNLIEIHDWPRFAVNGESGRQLQSALQYLLATKGTPVLYYGVEQGLNGDCHHDTTRIGDSGVRNGLLEGTCRDTSFSNHSRYRQDMFMAGPWRLGSVEPSISALTGIGWRAAKPASAAVDPFLNTNNSAFRSVRKAIAIRQSCEALRRGQLYFRAASDDARGGLLAFSRIENGKEVLVVANTSRNYIPVNAIIIDSALNSNRPFARWKNLYNGFETGTVGALGNATALYMERKTEAGGKEAYGMAPESVAIFVDEANVTDYRDDLGAHLCRN